MIRVRTYGKGEKVVVLLHGGPAAPGYMAPLARQLSDSFRMLEPLQRGSGEKPLTVATHVEDLHEVLTTMCPRRKPALVGHSWGAMLALAYAAEHSTQLSSIALVGCGTFDKVARYRLIEIREERMDDSMRKRIGQIENEIVDPDKRLAAMGEIMSRLDAYDSLSSDEEPVSCDLRAHEESWQDMLRLQEECVYPAAFRSIGIPVAMFHGTYDVHPGRLIRDGLKKRMPQLEYREWERCGHYPWREREVHLEFLRELRCWLNSHL